MSDTNEQDRAFPSVLQYFPEDTNYHQEQCMTLRDYFSAKAMAAYLMPAGTGQTWAQRSDFDYIAETAYLAADAMLRARGQS